MTPDTPSPPPSRTPRDKAIAATLVALQLALLLVLAFPQPAWTPPPLLRWTGILLITAGLLTMIATAATLRRGLTPSPLPNAHAKLRTTGPYRYVRHPMYTGLLATALGWTLTTPSPLRAGTLLALTALLTTKARWEETHLTKHFPAYKPYTHQVPRLLPTLTPHRPTPPNKPR
ncbi:isoprenylcysteine carboxylmethyltransferase family protein [Saccharothrix sp. NPDC042600]|uniref:methyltransferase family protein n=1 Tax=Saccharothrix TaxID=2071 RepID=UPI0033C510BE|nr:hypothetical protein GCM10017745_66880 [Saccharothrix mutabilis subsp. capreolus]